MSIATAAALLFDMDGVLIDSTPAVRRCWSHWVAARGLRADSIEKVAHGRRAIDTIRVLAPHLDAEAELKVMEELECSDLADIVAVPGAPTLVSDLPASRWTVVTSATERLARIRLRAGGVPAPARMITSEMVANGKPDPEGYRKGAEMLGFSPSECIVVEDAPAGIEAAKAAGCRVVALLTTHQRHELPSTDWVARDLASVDVIQFPDGLRIQIDD